MGPSAWGRPPVELPVRHRRRHTSNPRARPRTGRGPRSRRRRRPRAHPAGAGGRGTGENSGTDPLRLLPAYVSTLENLAEDRLVWLVIEDLHWVDAPSRDLFAYLLRVAGPCRLHTVITIRTHDPTVDPAAVTLAATLAALAGSERISLAPLGPDDVSTLVADLVGSPTPEQVDRAVALSQGSPLFAEQLVAAGLPATGPVPEQVLQPMTARVAALDPPTGHLVQIASLAEGHLSHRLLTQAYAATTFEGDDMESAAGQALDAHILRYDPGRHAYSFTHALLRQAAEASMAPAERIRGHRAWAHVLSQPQNHAGDRLLQIAAAHHWAEAEDDVQAFDSALSAADHAAWLGGPREVAALLRRALIVWDRIPDPEVRAARTRDVLLLDAIVACDNAGRFTDAVEMLNAELNRAVDTDTLRILCLRVMYADLRGVVGADVDLTVFDEAASRVDELFSAEPTPLVCSALRRLGWHLRYTEPDESLRIHMQAAQVAGQLDHKHRRGSADVVHRPPRAARTLRGSARHARSGIFPRDHLPGVDVARVRHRGDPLPRGPVPTSHRCVRALQGAASRPAPDARLVGVRQPPAGDGTARHR